MNTPRNSENGSNGYKTWNKLDCSFTKHVTGIQCSGQMVEEHHAKCNSLSNPMPRKCCMAFVQLASWVHGAIDNEFVVTKHAA
jgi:hypothetical protein